MKRLEVTSDIADVQVRAAGDGPEHFTIRGHAAVFGRLSENLGGFRERIAPGAFTRALDRTPDVRLLIDHSPSSVLARTTNGTLELREDPQGLHVWARIRSDLPEAAGLRARLDSGLIDQMSFAFTVDPDNDVRSGEDENGVPIYEVREVRDMFDVSTVTYGAYPQTDVSLVRMRMLTEHTLNEIRAAEGLAPLTVSEIARGVYLERQREDDTAAPEAPAVEAGPDREFITRRRKAIIRVQTRLLETRR